MNLVTYVTPLHDAEWAHAVERYVFRRELSATRARELRQLYREDRERHVWRAVGFPAGAWERCLALAHDHVAALGSRTLDSLHVACAIELGADRFWSFDDRQLRLARAAGLRTNA